MTALGGGADVPSAGDPPGGRRVIISQRMTATAPGHQTGTWVAAGAINDAGHADATAVIVEHGGGKALLKATHTLSGADGTLTLESYTWLRPFPPPMQPRVMVEGKWKQVAATGVYSGIETRGKLYAAVDQLTGEITIVRRGRRR